MLLHCVRFLLVLGFLWTLPIMAIVHLLKPKVRQMSRFIGRLAATRRKLAEIIANKGWYRFTHVAGLGVILALLVGTTGGWDAAGWLFSLLNNSAEILIGTSALYWLGRTITHTRTHEIEDAKERNKRENVLLLCIAIIIGFSLG